MIDYKQKNLLLLVDEASEYNQIVQQIALLRTQLKATKEMREDRVNSLARIVHHVQSTPEPMFYDYIPSSYPSPSPSSSKTSSKKSDSSILSKLSKKTTKIYLSIPNITVPEPLSDNYMILPIWSSICLYLDFESLFSFIRVCKRFKECRNSQEVLNHIDELTCAYALKKRISSIPRHNPWNCYANAR